jgi:hypothetical protein
MQGCSILELQRGVELTADTNSSPGRGVASIRSLFDDSSKPGPENELELGRSS